MMEEENQNIERQICSLQMEKESYEDLIKEHNELFLLCKPISDGEQNLFQHDQYLYWTTMQLCPTQNNYSGYSLKRL